MARKLLCLLGLLLVLAAAAGARDRFVYPGIYATRGNYSNAIRSTEYAAFLTVSESDLRFFTLGYSDLRLDQPDWRYGQQFGIGAVTLLRQPYRIKTAYGRVEGRYEAKVFDYDYLDQADLAGVELLRNFGGIRVGAGFSYYDLRGYLRQVAQNYELRADGWPRPALGLTIQPNYTHTHDGRDLYSLAASASIRLHRRLSVAAGGFAGKRAFHFDHDLLILHNQVETQTGRAYFRIDYALTRSLNGMVEYVHSRFDSYRIDYLVVGLHARWPL